MKAVADTGTEQERIVADGLAITELKRQYGWKVLVRRIEDEIVSLTGELNSINIDSKNLADIGYEYVSKVKLIEGLNQIFVIVNDIEARKDEVQEQSHE